uniref:IST1 homolog n=1 Tax=Attheya septentrionalis TaxID=420275 RepID=A0A6T7INE1_9STRA|mmetsp:Transcript_26707/g.48495  ORF Transcript_26707/g.48495 Transcript_26707/m.48495 type:complete len:318 (+) Transcript_26707:184-1137(+)
MFFGGFKGSKVKPQLKMAVHRFQISSNKKTALMKQQMREISKLLTEDPPKEEKAKIRAEALIREDNTCEAYEILQLSCELLSERIKLLESHQECPTDLVKSISTLMWASYRVDNIPELTEIRKQFRSKYGKKFEENALANRGNVLNERVVAKLSAEPPSAYLVQTYLEKICDEFDVDWKPTIKLTVEEMSEPMAAPVGYSVPIAVGTRLAPATTGEANADFEIRYIPPPTKSSASTPYTPATATATASPYVPPSAPTNASTFDEPDIYIPGPPPSNPQTNINTGNPKDDSKEDNDGTKGNAGPSYDDLAARFNQLKK